MSLCISSKVKKFIKYTIIVLGLALSIFCIEIDAQIDAKKDFEKKSTSELVPPKNSDLNLTCEQVYKRDKSCPKERCELGCLGGDLF